MLILYLLNYHGSKIQPLYWFELVENWWIFFLCKMNTILKGSFEFIATLKVRLFYPFRLLPLLSKKRQIEMVKDY